MKVKVIKPVVLEVLSGEVEITTEQYQYVRKYVEPVLKEEQPTIKKSKKQTRKAE